MASYIPPHKRRAAAAAAAAANKTTTTTAPTLSTTSSTSTTTTTQRWQPRHLQRSGGGGGGGGSGSGGGSSSRLPRNEVRREFQARQNEVRQAPRRTNSRWAAAAAPEPDSFGNVCQCASGQSSIYPCRQNTDHTVHHDLAESNPKKVLGKSLLGTHGQFCGGYYHTAASTEAGNPALCVGEGCIKAPTCVLVVRLEIDNSSDTLEAVFVSRYTNCYRGYEDSVHAEQFMMADPALLAILDAGECRGRCLFYGKRHSFLPLFFSLPLFLPCWYAPFPLLLFLSFSSLLFSSLLSSTTTTTTTTTTDNNNKR